MAAPTPGPAGSASLAAPPRASLVLTSLILVAAVATTGNPHPVPGHLLPHAGLTPARLD